MDPLSTPQNKASQEIYQDWLAAKAVIEKFLVELVPRMAASPETLNHNSSALLARLAHEDLLVCRSAHMREDL